MSSKVSRSVGRFLQQAELIARGHIFNSPFKPRELRRKQRYAATRDSVMRYLKRYADGVRAAKPEKLRNPAPEPERAFTIWYQGEENAPELVKSCFRAMRKHLKQELVVLDADTIFDWITLPDYIVRKWKEGKIHNTQFSDICRVELLYQHGGLWLDATDFVTAPVPDYIMDEDFFLFLAGERIRGSYAFIQSCFIRSRKGNPLMGVWREANFIYWKEEDSKVNYFILHLLFLLCIRENAIAKEHFDRMPKVIQDPTHTLWEHYAEKMDAERFRELTKDAFFQKTSYKSKGLDSLPDDSIGAYVINSKG